MSAQTAKSKVSKLCETLSAVCPRQTDDQIQEAAIDLHDIETSCRKIASSIHALRKGVVSKGHVDDQLDEIEGELFDHIVPNHLSSLKNFFDERNAIGKAEVKKKR